jgi:hypothetical protein
LEDAQHSSSGIITGEMYVAEATNKLTQSVEGVKGGDMKIVAMQADDLDQMPDHMVLVVHARASSDCSAEVSAMPPKSTTG